MRNDIVITGEGIVCAIGLDKQQVLKSLREKRTGISEIKYLNSIHHDLPVGEVPLTNDEMKKQLGLGKDTYVNRTTLMSILAVRQALTDAGIESGSDIWYHSGWNGYYRTFFQGPPDF